MVNPKEKRHRKTYKFTPEGLSIINSALEKLADERGKQLWHTCLESKSQETAGDNSISADTLKKVLGQTVGDRVEGGERGVDESSILKIRTLLVRLLEETDNTTANRLRKLKRGQDWEEVVSLDLQDLDHTPEEILKKPVISNQTLPAIPVWQGRDDLLERLQESLQDPMLRVLVILGQGGIGKTSLAVKLLEAIQENYAQTYFLKVQEGSSFDDLAAMVLGDLRINCKNENEAICAITNLFSKQHCLLVLDELEEILQPFNRCAVAEEFGKLLNAFAYSQHNSHIILTSRELPADLADERGGEIDPMLVRMEIVQGVDPDASIAILKERKLKDSDEDLEWVAKRVDGHVFLLSQLAALAKDRKGYLRKHPELVTKKSDPILQEQLARQTEAARDLLRRMSVLRIPIDVEGLTFLRLYTEEDRFENAALKGEPVDFTDDELEETEYIIEQLTAANLVQSRYDENCCSFLYDLHRITIDFLQKAYTDSLPDLMQIAYKFYCTGKTLNNPQSIEDILPIIEAQYFAFQLGKYREAIYLVLENLERYLRRWGYWKQLNEIYQLIIPYVNEYVDKIDLPGFLCRIGISYKDISDINSAEYFFQNALKMAINNVSEHDTAYALECLVDIEDKKGNWDIAAGMIRQSLEIRQKLIESDDLATCLLLLAQSERKLGNWHEAEEVAKQALCLFEKFKNNEGIAMSWETLGDIERNRQNWHEAEEFYKQSYILFEKLGNSEKIARYFSVLGDIKRNLKDWDEAEKLYKNALQLRTEIGARRGVAICIESLGQNELGKGNLEEAERFLKQALSEMELLGMTWHIGSANAELAILEKKRGNISVATEHYKKSHEIYTRLGAVKYLERVNRRWEE
jgi:tetratricopeptide (TPR) repeat protein